MMSVAAACRVTARAILPRQARDPPDRLDKGFEHGAHGAEAAARDLFAFVQVLELAPPLAVSLDRLPRFAADPDDEGVSVTRPVLHRIRAPAQNMPVSVLACLPLIPANP